MSRNKDIKTFQCIWMHAFVMKVEAFRHYYLKRLTSLVDNQFKKQREFGKRAKDERRKKVTRPSQFYKTQQYNEQVNESIFGD